MVTSLAALERLKPAYTERHTQVRRVGSASISNLDPLDCHFGKP